MAMQNKGERKRKILKNCDLGRQAKERLWQFSLSKWSSVLEENGLRKKGVVPQAHTLSTLNPIHNLHLGY